MLQPMERPNGYFTDAEPLGPTATPERMDEDGYRSLFDRENLLFSKLSVDELDGPIIVVGRRGSGKTAFLKSTHFAHPRSIVIEMVPNETFRNVVSSINHLAKISNAFVEDVRDIWNYLFWITAFQETYLKHQTMSDNVHVETIKRFLISAGIRTPSQPYEIFVHILSILERRYNAEGSLTLLKKAFKRRSPTFDEARAAMDKFLKEKNLRVFFLLDNLEYFELEKDEMTKAIAGLTKCVSEFRRTRDRHHLRWCVTAELYHQIIELSTNPLKDFSQQILLHWHAGEILQLAAVRYASYLKAHENEFYKRKLERMILKDRSEIADFWKIVLPARVTNGFGREEDSVAYILRHTQLLPRQILRYLNAIISYNVREYGSRFKIESDSITSKIRDIEGVVSREICTAFGSTYPTAYKTCDATLPNLPYVFKTGELQKTFTRFAKRLGVFEDFDHFRRMMIEIGAIGVVTGETEYYVNGIFEYTEPHKLSVSSDDVLCLHPIFFRTFRTNFDGNWKPVYPYGTDPESPDRRINV